MGLHAPGLLYLGTVWYLRCQHRSPINFCPAKQLVVIVSHQITIVHIQLNPHTSSTHEVTAHFSDCGLGHLNGSQCSYMPIFDQTLELTSNYRSGNQQSCTDPKLVGHAGRQHNPFYLRNTQKSNYAILQSHPCFEPQSTTVGGSCGGILTKFGEFDGVQLIFTSRIRGQLALTFLTTSFDS